MIALGTPITYHHRAAVARYTKGNSDFSWRKGWALFEGVPKHGYNDQYVKYADMFKHWPEIKRPDTWARKDELINKTVMVWPEDGSGVVIGRVRRMRGTSESGRYYSDGDADPGYFAATDGFHFYVVRARLDGLMDYMLIPEWAAKPIHHE